MSRFATGMGVLVLASAVLAAGSGCVAVNIGQPKVVVRRVPATETEKTPFKTEVTSVEVKAKVEGNRLSAWLDADVREEFRHWEYTETTTTTTQKRFSVGLFPGATDLVYRPRGEPSKLGMFAKHESSWLLMGLGILPLLSTIESLVFEPFKAWHSDCDAGWKRVEAQLGAPKADIHYASHLGLVGIHKSLRTTQTGPVREGPNRESGSEARRRTVTIGGPYEVELRVVGTDIAGKARVGEWDSHAIFDLPQVDNAGRYEATLTFQSLYSGTDAVKSAWKTRTLTQWVWLQEKPKPNPVVAYTPTPAQAPVREVVKEIHHYHETRVVEEKKPEGAPWEIKTVEPFKNGRAEYLVTIRDASKKAFEVEREVKPDIERLLRDGILAAQPGMDARAVRAYALPEFDGRTIRFKGVAFSVQPLTDGWRYDEDTRRGSVRLRISEGMSPDEAKRWARDNIEAIVKEKNVALEAGAVPPSGAVYRSLGEQLEDGVLTVEFEAVE